jgi:thymidylate synthase ThyX
MSTATIITDDPIVEVLADMKLNHPGVMAMAKWVERYRPNCVPEAGFNSVIDLLPHDGYEPLVDHQDGTNLRKRLVTDNELLAEIAGRKCYDSFAEAGAARTNGDYLESMWAGRIPHRSTGYHPKMSFFFAHISRRVSHELIRAYVGADRDEEGSPSQESTRFTHHPGIYIAHPHYLGNSTEMACFRELAELNYSHYRETIERKVFTFARDKGAEPKGLDRKRIYESSAGDLLMSCGTSMVWTTNPMALVKLFLERDDDAADMEMARFARKLKRVSFQHWPNLFYTFFDLKTGKPREKPAADPHACSFTGEEMTSLQALVQQWNEGAYKPEKFDGLVQKIKAIPS